jgi:alpha-L-fucosidase
MKQILLTFAVFLLVFGCAKNHNSESGYEKQKEIIKKFQQLKYGMFIHYGMSTFTGREIDPGDMPSTTYAPTDLNVDQWIRTARDAGMKYAVLTSKHVSGHCLWDSKVQYRGKEYDYDVGTSSDPTDVIAAFMEACKKYDIKPGLYYCLMDTHNSYGPDKWQEERLMPEYFQFVKDQLSELLHRYPDIFYLWLDIPRLASQEQRAEIYNMIKEIKPECVVLYNFGLQAGDSQKKITVEQFLAAWPTDVLNSERYPLKPGLFDPEQSYQGEKYYLGYEHCDPLGKDWFWVPEDRPRPLDSIYHLYSQVRAAGGNLLLDVAPDTTGHIPDYSIGALMQLRDRIDNN